MTAAGDHALSSAGDRPTLMILAARDPATTASTAGLTRRSAPYLCSGVEGRRPSPNPNVRTLGRLAHDTVVQG